MSRISPTNGLIEKLKSELPGEAHGGEMGSTTSSFRMSDELRARFEAAASSSGKGKNWILNQALREYPAPAGGLSRH